MKLITLDIGYDPEFPDSFQNCAYDQRRHYEAEYNKPQPWFPYKNSGVTFLGIYFFRKRVTTPGPDPYAGERWTAEVGKLELVLNSVICPEVILMWSHKRLFRICEYEYKDMPWWTRKLWAFLEERYEWWENHCDYDCDNLRYYE